MTHCSEKRFGCKECSFTTHSSTTVTTHMKRAHHIIWGIPTDKRNELRDALWRKWMHQYFPDFQEEQLPRRISESENRTGVN
ncbi:hypothetical protein PENTCL1PPCAC_16348 [Pristionchus entomophagus]|uniref:C2H2-type domain-containing protein n=1 Tax=Pristionchus entomophagus TaxID=358040 RepID=A0AAV5TIT3_9BILA|nr:hypothetical protein PENTCL1PPCAC_16348 [Pristionchus entomophagus]